MKTALRIFILFIICLLMDSLCKYIVYFEKPHGLEMTRAMAVMLDFVASIVITLAFFSWGYLIFFAVHYWVLPTNITHKKSAIIGSLCAMGVYTILMYVVYFRGINYHILDNSLYGFLRLKDFIPFVFSYAFMGMVYGYLFHRYVLKK